MHLKYPSLPRQRSSGLPHPSVPQLPQHYLCPGWSRPSKRTSMRTRRERIPRLKPHFVRPARARANGHRRGYWATTPLTAGLAFAPAPAGRAQSRACEMRANVVITTAYLIGQRASACEAHHRVMAKRPSVDRNNAMGRGFWHVSTPGAGGGTSSRPHRTALTRQWRCSHRV